MKQEPPGDAKPRQSESGAASATQEAMKELQEQVQQLQSKLQQVKKSGGPKNPKWLEEPLSRDTVERSREATDGLPEWMLDLLTLMYVALDPESMSEVAAVPAADLWSLVVNTQRAYEKRYKRRAKGSPRRGKSKSKEKSSKKRKTGEKKRALPSGSSQPGSESEDSSEDEYFWRGKFNFRI